MISYFFINSNKILIRKRHIYSTKRTFNIRKFFIFNTLLNNLFILTSFSSNTTNKFSCNFCFSKKFIEFNILTINIKVTLKTIRIKMSFNCFSTSRSFDSIFKSNFILLRKIRIINYLCSNNLTTHKSIFNSFRRFRIKSE